MISSASTSTSSSFVVSGSTERTEVSAEQPMMKLVVKTRHGAKVQEVYDTARTPYHRLLEAGVLTGAKRREMAGNLPWSAPSFAFEAGQ